MAVNKTLQRVEVAALLALVGRRLERHLDLPALWRLFGWGAAAAISLGAVVLVGESQSGAERLQLAFAREPGPQAVAA
ncbi:MAG TPA: hypothetical protein VMI47_06970, partial [Pseudolabrys sp.]|nr:hypothetical protein [Pseudolabrys sp.]